MEHTKEPWEIRHDPGMFSGALCIVQKETSQFVSVWASHAREADARRTVACVNACAGIPTELLEAGRIIEYKMRTEAQREKEGER